MPDVQLSPIETRRVAAASRRYLPMSDRQLGRRFVALAAKIASPNPAAAAEAAELAQREAFERTVGDRFE